MKHLIPLCIAWSVLGLLTAEASIVFEEAGSGSSADTPVVLSVQSSARPYRLDIAGPVYQAGSDSASAVFQSENLPVLQAFINANLSESRVLDNVSAVSLDPTKLRLQTASDIRVYFLGEGAGYHNTLGYNVNASGIKTGDPLLIFPDASSVNSYFNDGNAAYSAYYRNSQYPLLPGDFVDLGTHAGGQQLDFFLIANGASGGKNIWTANESLNVDLTQHVVAFAVPDSPYLLIGFEDLYGGGDLDYNDLVFAVDIGELNVTHLANPEPASILIFCACVGALVWFQKRNRLPLQTLAS